MSTEVQQEGPAKRPDPELADRLGYLFKHVHLRLNELTSQALAPHGISGRELAVLVIVASPEPLSQQQIAARLGIDRTTMVAFLDALEDKGLLARQADPNDRRRNVIVLTDTGRDVLRDARGASEEAERQFLAPLTESAAAEFKRALGRLL
jgi:DNA-binding MarR family transcriptional regulator